MKKVLGVLGKPGAGKDTFCDYFEEVSDSVKVIKFSDSLSKILLMFLDEIKREDQQWLVNQLRDRFGEDVLARATKKNIKKLNTDFILLNGVRVGDDKKMVEEIGGDLVYIKTDPKVRWKRMKSRGEKKDDDVSFDEFLKLDGGRSEKEIESIGEGSDYIINNNGTKKDLKKEVLNLIEELNE